MKNNVYKDSVKKWIRPMKSEDVSRVAEILIFAKRSA